MSIPTEVKNDNRVWIRVGLGFVVAWIAYLVFFGPRDDPGGLTPPDLARSGHNVPVDYEWTVEDLEGKPVKLSAFQGKTIFLNVWATWCGPCLREMPAIENLATNGKWKDRDIVFLAISTDMKADTLRRFVKDRPMTGLTVLRTTTPPPLALDSDGIPATFVIDRAGKVVVSQIGSAAWDDASVVDYLDKLTAQK